MTPTVVVLRALKLGDLLTAVPALRAIRAAYPDHRRVLATPAPFAPLVRQEGLADVVSDTVGLRPLDPALEGPAVAIDLHGRGPGSQPLLLALRPDRLVAFAHPDIPATAGGPPWRPGEHEVVRWCRLLSESGIPADPTALAVGVPDRPLPEFSAGATIVHPGAASGSRRWPAERFAAVARAERDAGREVLVTGGPDEVALARRVGRSAGIPADRILAGSTDLMALIALVGHAGLLVSGDTGVAHVATAVGTPSVVLFGPVPPAEWGPPADRPRHVALWAGRTGDPHGAEVDPGLLEVTVDDVVTAIGALRTQLTATSTVVA